MQNNNKILNAIPIIDYAINNNVSLRKASLKFGYAETYVKNIKRACIDEYNKGNFSKSDLDLFLEKHKEFLNSKSNSSTSQPTPNQSLKSENNIKIIVGDTLNNNSKDIDTDNSDFNSYCKEHGIDSKDIITYWHKSKQYSIYVRNNQEKLNQQFEILKEILKSEVTPLKRERKTNVINNTDSCAVVNIFDLHIDKKAYNSSESGINEVLKVKEEIKNGFDDILKSTLIHNPNTIIFPIGNDLLNSNGFTSETVKGTPQKNLVEGDAAFRQALDLCKYMIDKLILESNAKILIPIVSGNHSAHGEFYLGVCLEVMYHNNPLVEINNEIKDDRKYYIFEDILFAFMHGDKYLNKIQQLPMIVMQENRDKLSRTKFTQCYLGDRHHKQEFKFMRTKDFPGCNVTFLRGTSVTDAWHQDNGYIGVPRTIESFIWKKNKGQVANYSINL